MGKVHYRTRLATQYSAFPALIVVREEDNGCQAIIPIPLSGSLLWRWLWMLVVGMLPRSRYGTLVVRLLSEARWLADDVADAFQRTRVSLRLGTVLFRSLTWGVLGV